MKKSNFDYLSFQIFRYEPDEENLSTLIFSDCFQIYQTRDFYEQGYILHRVNHSVLFVQGHFHTNSIESTWIKKNNKKF